MLVIDGSEGEGGGQVLRTALTLAAATKTPFRIERIRARRSRPGLLRQHLASVRAAAAIAGARVRGDTIGSQELELTPGRIAAGEHAFAVGTAGSTTLVLETVLPLLLLADGPSRVAIEGGTHNPLAPTSDFLELALFPLLARMGATLELSLERAGFYPAGGGRLALRAAPPAAARPLVLLERGPAWDRYALIDLSRLPERIAEEEASVLAAKLALPPEKIRIRRHPDGAGPGNVVQVVLVYEHVTEVEAAFGAKGVRAEAVALQAVQEARRYLRATAPVGRHLADQLLVPMALLAGGAFRTVSPSPHTRTNADVINRFLGPVVTLEEEADEVWRVMVSGTRAAPPRSTRSVP